MGIDVVPTLIAFKAVVNLGTRYPTAIPMPMARNIQSVRYRSRKDSFLETVIEFEGIGLCALSSIYD